jgi:ATP-binding cassette, subfamily B, bacterial
MTDEAPSSAAGWQLLRSALHEQRAGLFLGMVVAMTWAAGRVAVPLLVQLGIDRGIEQGGSMVGWSLAILGAGAVSGVMLGLRRYLAFWNARTVEARLRDRLFAHIQRLHFAFHDANATGDLMSRANTDLQQFQNVVTQVPVLTGNAITVVAVTIIMIIVQPLLAVLALASLPAVNFLGRQFSKKLFPAVAGVQRESAALATVVEETVSGIRVVKGFGAEPVQRSKLSDKAGSLYDESLTASMVRSRYLPAIEIMPNLGLITVLGYGGHLVLDRAMTIGQLVSFNIYVMLLVPPLRMLGMAVTNGQRSAAAGVRIQEVLSTDPVIVAPDHPEHLPQGAGQGRVEFENVEFSYHAESNQPVLHRFTLSVEPGESIALVGPTGSGKTTVANLLPRFYDVDGGQIRLDGVDITRLPPRELRRAVGIVFEETFLFSASVRDNIAFANPDASIDEVHRAARLAGADFVEDLPKGFNTELGERGFSLSGGQRQRLAIARAILADPRVLILDDATSAVDPTKEHEIRDALGEVMDRRTTIVIAHRAATVALADRVVLLDEGSIVAEGTHSELLATSQRYRQVLAAAEVVA